MSEKPDPPRVPVAGEGWGTAELGTVGGALKTALAALRATGVADAGTEARRLVARIAGLSALTVATAPEQTLDASQQAALADAIGRRAAREPLSRIAGERDFYGRTFRIAPATLDPRADTETVIDAVLELVRAEAWQARPLRILDIGTGSGCLILTLLAELPDAVGLATDVAEAALAAAEANAVRLGLAARARFELARSLTGIDGPFDIVVSNPPYIPTGDIAGLDEEVRRYDPLAALDGGVDGLAVYREIAVRLPDVCPAGWAVFEVGCDQAADVAEILARAPWPAGPQRRQRSWKDLGGHTRVVAIRAH